MNPILDFLTEIVVRLRNKSPKFFKVLQVISILVALIPGIPTFLDYLGIVLPDFLIAIENKTIAIAGIVAAFLTGLPVEKTTNTTGSLRTSTATKTECPVLPFSDKQS